MVKYAGQYVFEQANENVNESVFGSILYNVKAYGAKGDGVTDDTASIQAANATATVAKTPLFFPSGTYKVSALTLTAPIIYGAGWGVTVIKGNSASGDVITLSGDHTVLTDMKVTSSVAAASRTGSGVKVTGGVQILVSRVHAVGHRYGFWHQGVGNEFEHCFAEQCNSHGFFIDGSVTPQNEVGMYFCQSNNNAGDGFHLSGPGLGVRMTNVTAASNDGWGIDVANGLNDVWMTVPEISGNGGGIRALACSDIQIVSPFIETSIVSPNLWLGCSMTTVVGGFSQGALSASLGYGIIIDSTDVSVVGMVISSNNVAGILVGAACVRTVLSANIISNTASTGVTSDYAIRIDTGAGPMTITGCDMSSITAIIDGAIPAGSVVSGCKGLTTSLGNGWTTNADAAVNGYIQFVDASGTLRKVATIA